MKHIGKGVEMGMDVRVWPFSYIGDQTRIGDGPSIGSLVHIDHHVVIGKNCRIQGMVYLPPRTVVGDNVFIGPGVILTNDPFPPSSKLKGVTIKDNAVICAAAVILPGVTIGDSAVVGRGAIVRRDVDEYKARQDTWVNQKT